MTERVQVLHPSITAERVLDMIEESGCGVCVACGEETVDEVDPDDRCVECESCGEPEVYGSDVVIRMLGA